MTDLLADISAWSILKWVIIVLIAGFIGQFGKSMAQAILKKIRLGKAMEAQAQKGTGEVAESPGGGFKALVSSSSQGAPADKVTEKAVKKARKSLLKSQKKASKINS